MAIQARWVGGYVKSVRIVALLFLLLVASCAPFAVTRRQCDIEKASALIGRVNTRAWDAWTPIDVNREFPELRRVSDRSGPPAILSVNWRDREDACTCCATLMFGDDARLEMATFFHEEDTFDAAIRVAEEFSRAAGNTRLISELRAAEPELPTEISFAVEESKMTRVTTFRLFQGPGPTNWYWQYQETRGSESAMTEGAGRP